MVGLEICPSSSTPRRLRFTRVLSAKSNVPRLDRCRNSAPNGGSAGSRYIILNCIFLPTFFGVVVVNMVGNPCGQCEVPGNDYSIIENH